MIHYMVCFSIIILYGISIGRGQNLSKDNAPEKAKRFLFVAFALLGILYGLRSHFVGVDTFNYGIIFGTIGTSSYFNDFMSAPVYTAYNRIIYGIIPQYQAVLIINSLIIHLSVALFIYKFSCDVAMSVYLYVLAYIYFFSYNGARQSLALSLVLFAMISFAEKRWITAIMFTILSIGVHNSVVVLIPVLLLMNRPLSRKATGLFIAACLFMAFFISSLSDYVFELFVRFFPRYAMYLSGILRTNYMEGSAQGRNIYLTVFYLCILALYFFQKKNENQADGNETQAEQWLRNMMIPCVISVVIGLVFSNNSLLLRIREYFAFFFVCAIPILCENTKVNAKLLKYIVLAVMIIPFCIQLTENRSGVVPYAFFWRS